MPLSVYVHIPYCLQRCRYCDFTTFEWTEILPPERYASQVLQEIRNRHRLWPEREIATLYFGGGTPSLLAPELIVAIKSELANVGFRFQPDAEITIEINPATLTPEKLDVYLAGGINRFSVGAQTFDDALLSLCGRKHSARDTRATLELLRGYNYSFDLLFALPGQTSEGLQRDLEEVSAFAPPHLSAYCLTVPEGHPMASGRPPENEQVEMFDRIESHLRTIGLHKYEISNFAQVGMESRHNGVYWRDESYWGIGLSSHSYSPSLGTHGMRFWNPKSLKEYALQVERCAEDFTAILPDGQYERLKTHEALTDFSHMFLRTMRGLPEDALHNKFAPLIVEQVKSRLQRLVERGWLESSAGHWQLSREGQLLSNKVFEELTFLPADLADRRLTGSKADPYCSV
ncbi:MAG: radical SAM family heme chaperone HemW [Bdellovibrionales bacterium]|nr:radical SAM family heme chaperone HemW [Bdellovibrionales bacterium]